METFSALLAICAGNSPVPGEFPTQRPVTRSFDVYFDLRPNKRLSKQWWGWWFETQSCPLWRHRNVAAKMSRSKDSDKQTQFILPLKIHTDTISGLQTPHKYAITKCSWYIVNLSYVGRPPLRSYRTVGLVVTRRERVCTCSEIVNNSTFYLWVASSGIAVTRHDDSKKFQQWPPGRHTITMTS